MFWVFFFEFDSYEDINKIASSRLIILNNITKCFWIKTILSNNISKLMFFSLKKQDLENQLNRLCFEILKWLLLVIKEERDEPSFLFISWLIILTIYWLNPTVNMFCFVLQTKEEILFSRNVTSEDISIEDLSKENYLQRKSLLVQ